MRYKLFFFFLLILCTTNASALVDNSTLDRNGTGAIVIITGIVLSVLLIMSCCGHRMRNTAIRWFTINICLWGFIHMLYVSAYYDRAPWPNWFQSDMWSAKMTAIQSLGRTVFPVGVVPLLIERVVLFAVPHYEESKVWHSMMAAIYLVGHNLFLVLFFSFEYASWECADPDPDPLWCYWYSPVELVAMYSYAVHVVCTILYLLFALFTLGFCGYSMFMFPDSAYTPQNFVNIWLYYLYAFIPVILYGCSTAMAVVPFVIAKIGDWLIEHGLLSLVLGGGGGDGIKLPFGLQLSDLMRYAQWFLDAMPWFTVSFPLIEAILTLFCIPMYREQLFHVLSFGNLYADKPECLRRQRQKYIMKPPQPIMLVPVQETLNLSPVQAQGLRPASAKHQEVKTNPTTILEDVNPYEPKIVTQEEGHGEMDGTPFPPSKDMDSGIEVVDTEEEVARRELWEDQARHSTTE